MLSAVRRVEKPGCSGRDCLVFMVSPGYGMFREADEAWREYRKYFGVLSSCLPSDPLLAFGFREQFMNADGSLRMRQMWRALDVVGKEHLVGVLYFYGSYLGGDLRSRRVFVDRLDGYVRLMERSLRVGKIIPVQPEQTWW
ncbi:MAG: hypothetical protein HY360_20865 [Verrucomicrobia bacterium]|nr:hypothetical protein [Verrucomicrobiota bacterium]